MAETPRGPGQPAAPGASPATNAPAAAATPPAGAATTDASAEASASGLQDTEAPSSGRQHGAFLLFDALKKRRARAAAKPAEQAPETLEAEEDENDPGRALFRCTFVLFRTATFYALNNAAVAGPLGRMLEAVEPFIRRDGVLALHRRHDGLYVNNRLVPRDGAMEDLYPYVETAYDRLGVHEILFQPGTNEAALREFLAHFQKRLRGEGAPGTQRWATVQVRELPEERDLAQRRERERVVGAYAMASVRATEVLNALAAGKMPNFTRLRSALAGVLDLPASLEPVLVASLPVGREAMPRWSHAINCAVLAGLVARRMGLSRRRQLAAATAAVLHDFHSGLSGGVADPKRPVRLLAQVKHQGAELAERVVTLAEVSFPVPEGVRPTLLSRLVKLTLAFEKLLAGSPERAPLTSDQAIRLLAAEAGRRYDAQLLAVLCRTVGFFPPGTLLVLSTNEAAVVLSVPTDPRKLATPEVRLASGAAAGRVVDLATDPSRKVVRTVIPSDVGRNPLPWVIGA